MTGSYARRSNPAVPSTRPFEPFKLHAADDNRRKRRAIVKAIGARQFKKLYRGVPA